MTTMWLFFGHLITEILDTLSGIWLPDYREYKITSTTNTIYKDDHPHYRVFKMTILDNL